MGRIIEVDTRGRVSIGKAGSRYILHEGEGGSLLLTPAVVMTQAELDMWRAHPGTARQIDEALRKGEESLEGPFSLEDLDHL